MARRLNYSLSLCEIAALVVLPEMQLRAKTDPGTIKRYAQAMRSGVEFPPILAADLDGAFILVDGFHRVAAMQSLGIRQTPADVRPVSTLEDARWLAARANLTHGLPLKAGERREVFRAYVRASQHRRGGKRGALKSYRDMAADLGGMAHTTLRNWTKRDFPSVFRALGGDDGPAPGGLPDTEPSGQIFAREASEALDKAIAALPGVTDAADRGLLLEKVEALKAAIEEAGVEAEAPF